MFHSTVLLSAIWPLVGCGSGEAKPTTAAPARVEGEAVPSQALGAAESGPVSKKVKFVDGPAPGAGKRYALKIDAEAAQAGQASKVAVRVEPKAPWHMNLDFPTSLQVTAPASVTLANAHFKKADAALDENACQFDVGFTPTVAGEHTFSGTLKFAVCQDEACSPVTEQLEFKVAVK